MDEPKAQIAGTEMSDEELDSLWRVIENLPPELRVHWQRAAIRGEIAVDSGAPAPYLWFGGPDAPGEGPANFVAAVTAVRVRTLGVLFFEGRAYTEQPADVVISDIFGIKLPE